MPIWIRFQFEAGETCLINVEQTYILFKPEERRIDVYPMQVALATDDSTRPICRYLCETAEQVRAAEELILEGTAKGEAVTINLEVLDEHADYLHNVYGMRMVLQLLHFGRIRIPMGSEFDEQDLFGSDPSDARSEISQFEDMLGTFLDVPEDSLRRAYRKEAGDLPFELGTDHEECVDHGFHEYWIVKTLPDRHYRFREHYDDLARSIVEKDGFSLDTTSAS